MRHHSSGEPLAEKPSFPRKAGDNFIRRKNVNKFNESRQSDGGFYLETDDDVTYGFVA
jgi:hypothetical protein